MSVSAVLKKNFFLDPASPADLLRLVQFARASLDLLSYREITEKKKKRAPPQSHEKKKEREEGRGRAKRLAGKWRVA